VGTAAPFTADLARRNQVAGLALGPSAGSRTRPRSGLRLRLRSESPTVMVLSTIGTWQMMMPMAVHPAPPAGGPCRPHRSIQQPRITCRNIQFNLQEPSPVIFSGNPNPRTTSAPNPRVWLHTSTAHIQPLGKQVWPTPWGGQPRPAGPTRTNCAACPRCWHWSIFRLRPHRRACCLRRSPVGGVRRPHPLPASRRSPPLQERPHSGAARGPRAAPQSSPRPSRGEALRPCDAKVWIGVPGAVIPLHLDMA
jgi:hypothetical protein